MFTIMAVRPAQEIGNLARLVFYRAHAIADQLWDLSKADICVAGLLDTAERGMKHN